MPCIAGRPFQPPSTEFPQCFERRDEDWRRCRDDTVANETAKDGPRHDLNDSVCAAVRQVQPIHPCDVQVLADALDRVNEAVDPTPGDASRQVCGDDEKTLMQHGHAAGHRSPVRNPLPEKPRYPVEHPLGYLLTEWVGRREDPEAGIVWKFGVHGHESVESSDTITKGHVRFREGYAGRGIVSVA